MKKLIYFVTHEDVTPAGMDGAALSFPFYIVDSQLLGKPEEKSSTERHRVLVSIADARRRGWHISDEDLPKVLFEFGKRHLVEILENGAALSESTLTSRMITTASHPGPCPFEFSRQDGFQVGWPANLLRIYCVGAAERDC